MHSCLIKVGNMLISLVKDFSSISTIALFILLIPPLRSHAQTPQVDFYDISSGLSDNRTWHVDQDADGYLWIMTNAFNRFDGHSFLHHRNHKGSPFRQFRTVIHFRTAGDEVIYLNEDQLMAYNVHSGELQTHYLPEIARAREELRYNLILYTGDTAIITARGSEGLMILKYFNGKFLPGVIMINHYLETWRALQLVVNERGEYTFADPDSNTLYTFSPGGKLLYEQKLPHAAQMMILGKGKQGRILAGWDGKIYLVDQKAGSYKEHPVNPHLENFGNIHYFLETDNGDIWISGTNRQLALYRESDNSFRNFQDAIAAKVQTATDLGRIFIDRTGVLWITSVMGLIKVSLHEDLFHRYADGAETACGGQCSFRGITEDDAGNIYASYYSNVLRISAAGQEIDNPILPFQITPFDLYYINNKLLLNSGRIYDPQAEAMSNPLGSESSSTDLGIFTSDQSGRTWYGFGSSIYTADPGRPGSKWQELSMPRDDNILDIRCDPEEDALWIASLEGIRKYKPQRDSLKLLQEIFLEEPLFGRYLCKLQNRLWVATMNGLLSIDLETGKQILYTTNEGLCHNYIVTILPEGDSCLWLGTQGGLSRYSIATGRFVNFYSEDGLANEECNRRSAYKARNGRFYFGSISGLTAFYPSEVMEKLRQQQMLGDFQLTGFSKKSDRYDTTYVSRHLQEGRTLEILAFDRELQFNFALLDYRYSDKAVYSYRLKGYDDEWTVPTRVPQARFTNLSPGSYDLQVRAMTQRGQLHPRQLNLHLLVHPPWWASWWAYVAYIVLAGVLIAGIFLFLKRRWQLQNALLMEQQEALRLKELDGFKSRLYTNLTHEFRTPLTVILGMQEQMKNSWEEAQTKEEKSTVRRSLDMIGKNGKSLLRLINQLLDLSKLENNAFSLQVEKGDIISYLKYLSESFQTYASGRGLTLYFESRVDAIVMDFDSEQVKHILSNLLSNAIKFTREGGEVTVNVTREGEDLVIEVRDTGIGIADKDLRHIFDRFYQVDSSSTRAGEGTGIGLAHTQELIRVMGGSITVASEFGKGTRFSVILPIVDAAGTPLLNQNRSMGEVTFAIMEEGLVQTVQPAENGNLPVVLIVEDNSDVVGYLRSCLHDRYQIEVAYDGRAGIEKALELIPDVIVSDVMMPEKDGFEVCDILKQDERTSHVPIILLTARADVESRMTGFRRGADAYLSKPFNREELMIRMETMIRQKERMVSYLRTAEMNDPNELGLSPEPDLLVEHAFMVKVRKIVEAKYSDEHFSLPLLCREIGMSRSQLFRKMKALVEISPSEYIRNYRMEQAKKLLEEGGMTVSEVAWQVGFKYLPHFSKAFQETYGVPPSTYQGS